MTIDALERLRSHRQEAGGFPNRHAALHEPSGGGVPKRVRDNGAETGALAGRGEALLDVPDGLTVDVQNVAEIGPAFAGAQQVRLKTAKALGLEVPVRCSLPPTR